MRINLTDRQIKLLELLEKQISGCVKCSLYQWGRCLPYWTPFSQYLAIGEAPGKEEIDTEPFVGTAGKKLWEVAGQYGFRKEQFAIINSVQCRPVKGNSNGKPTKIQCQKCKPWIRKFLRIVDPQKIIFLGNYAKSFYDDTTAGIIRMNARDAFYYDELHDKDYPVIFSVHPSVCIYEGEKGEKLLSNSFKAFSYLGENHF